MPLLPIPDTKLNKEHLLSYTVCGINGKLKKKNRGGRNTSYGTYRSLLLASSAYPAWRTSRQPSFWWRIRYCLFRQAIRRTKTLSHAIRQGKNRKLLLQCRRKSRRFFSPVEYTRILIRWPMPEPKSKWIMKKRTQFSTTRSADNFTASKAAFRQPSEIKAVKRGGPLHHHIELSRAFLSNP